MSFLAAGLPEAGTWASFVAASALLIAVPGPNVALILAVSAREGLRAGLAAAAGTTAAQGVQIALAAGGLAWVAQSWGAAFDVLRWLGVAWLMWMGIQTLRRAGRAAAPADPGTSGRRAAARSMGRGVLVGLANPKTLLFHAAFLPQFVDASAPAGPQLAVLGATFAVVALTLDGLWACLGAAGRRGAGPLARVWMARGAGAALIGGALGLALVRRA